MKLHRPSAYNVSYVYNVISVKKDAVILSEESVVVKKIVAWAKYRFYSAMIF